MIMYFAKSNSGNHILKYILNNVNDLDKLTKVKQEKLLFLNMTYSKNI